MTRIPELGLDDRLPSMQVSQALRHQQNMGAAIGEDGVHEFFRLPSYEGFKAECGCGQWESEPVESMTALFKVFNEHLEAALPQPDEAAFLEDVARREWFGDVIGIRRLVDIEAGVVRHKGFQVAGTGGWVEFDEWNKAFKAGQWRPFTTQTKQEEG
ncbi:MULTISPECIES: hypothetical protein [unclassified Streptomyces]|uniref:hypothetical protein n=1 Tax=unclassified Streptomyces TaxID=2593676 RepID=UPI002E29EB9A|nr:hypothetical protein [Streptomyces sp. NBC_00285]